MYMHMNAHHQSVTIEIIEPGNKLSGKTIRGWDVPGDCDSKRDERGRYDYALVFFDDDSEEMVKLYR